MCQMPLQALGENYELKTWKTIPLYSLPGEGLESDYLQTAMRRMKIWKVQRKRAFGLGPGLGSRIPRGIHGVWGRSAGITRRFIILCFPAWWVLASGFRFCRDDGKNPGWSGGAGTLGLLEKARQLRTRASRLSALVGERRTHPRSSPPDSPQPPAFVACHGARSLCAAACENPAE